MTFSKRRIPYARFDDNDSNIYRWNDLSSHSFFEVSLFFFDFLNWTDTPPRTISLLFIHMPLRSFHSWFVGSYSHLHASFITLTNQEMSLKRYWYVRNYEPHICNVGMSIIDNEIRKTISQKLLVRMLVILITCTQNKFCNTC